MTRTIADKSAKVTLSPNRSDYRAPIPPERLALLHRRKSKRRTRQEEAVAQYYVRVLNKVLSAFDAPDCAFDFLAALLALTGFNVDRFEEIEVFDLALAAHHQGFTHKVSKATKAERNETRANRYRKQRRRIKDWQAIKDNPLFFEHDGSFNKETRKRNSLYKIHIAELIRAIVAAAPVGSADALLDAMVAQHCGEYLACYTGTDKTDYDRLERKPESNTHQAATALNRAVAKRHADAKGEACGQGRPETAEAEAEAAAKTLLAKDFLDRLDTQTRAILQELLTANPLQIQTVVPDTTYPAVMWSKTSEIVDIPLEGKVAFFGERERERKTPTALLTAEARVCDGESACPTIDEFMASNPAYHADSTPDAWREAAPTDKQRDVLARAGVYADVRTRGEASDRIAELVESGALCDWLSLAELERFDPKARGFNKTQRRFCCPLCGTDKQIDADHRSLSANTKTGEYHCHRCKTGGILREFTESKVIPARSFPALPTAKPEPTAYETENANRWRKWVEQAMPIQTSKPSNGAEYLASRGIPADVASVAGVRFGAWWKRNDEANKPESFAAVIFPIQDQSGELVAAQARAIVGSDKRTRGDKSQGVFLATPGALDAERLAICEAPIDALALAACGLDAIALCGTTWPEWLLDTLAGRGVFLAHDADAPGDQAANDLAEALAGQSFVKRLRPRGGKDWGEVLQEHGKAAIEAQIDFALGCAEPGSVDEWGESE